MERLIYLNGAMVAESEARISIFDVGRLYGACFYESIRTFGHRLFRLEEHMRRLERSLRYGGILPSLDWSRVREAVQKTLEANEPLTDPQDDLWLCVEVTPGTAFPMPLQSGAGNPPTVLAYSSELPHGEYVRCYSEGKAVITSHFRNIPPASFEQRCKNRARLPHYLSKLEAHRQDPQSYALMLDTDGFVSEGTGANIFFVVDGGLLTPSRRNILVGISRQYVIELAGRLELPVSETDVSLFDAYNAEEAFWTTTSYCILPISRIDGRPIGDGRPGPITRRLQAKWSEEVGVDIVAQARRFAGQGTK
jgi:branched-chain amino acid aminotransferase